MNATLQLFARKYGTNEWTLLDLFDTEPVILNLRVQDIVEPSLTVASYSQTFRVPHSYTNGKFFQQVFNVNQTIFDPSKKAQAYLNSEGQFYMNGNIQLLNVFRNDKTGNVEYEIVFVNELSDFASQIGLGDSSGKQGGYLSNLDVTDYVHPKDRTTIVNSWTGGLFGGDIVYPLVEHGYNYTGSGASTQPNMPTISTDGVQSFTSIGNPLRTGQMKPAMRVKAIWDRIFEQTDYTYESDFLNSDQFKSLYLLTDKEARAEINTTIGFSMTYYGFSVFANVGNPSPTLLFPYAVLYDFASNYNINQYVFTVNADGQYSFSMTANMQTFFGSTTGNERFVFFLKKGPLFNSPTWPGSSVDYYLTNGLTQDTFTITTPLLNFNAGDQIYFFATMVDPDNSVEYWFNLGNISTVVTPGSVIVPNNNLPDNIKQIDFIKGIAEKFKLVFEPTFQDEKKFYIEPWSEWIKGGIIRDWTPKLNADKDYKLTPLFQTQNRFMTFKDEEDSDYVNFNFQQAFKQTYGQLNKDSYIEVIRDTKEVKTMFAPIPLAPIGYGATASDPDKLAAEKWLIPHLAKDEVTKDGPGKRTPIQPKLRLGYYNGLTGATKDWYFVNSDPLSQYPLMSSYWPNPWDKDAISLDWSFSTPQWSTDLPENPSGRAKNYNYDLYWSKWYQSCYGETNVSQQGAIPDKDFAYIFEGEFILDYKDVVDLRFNDKIFVKDAYYLINSISGFKPHEKSVCKVQLYKLNNIGVQLPSTFLPITDVCFSPNSVCDAACCLYNSPISTIYSSDAPNLTSGSVIYLNASASVPGLSGYYSDGTNVYTVNATGGVINTVTPIAESECVCVPELDPQELCFAPGTGPYCEACCCANPSVTIWVENNGPTWYQNTYFYANSTGGPAPTGWYSDGTRFLYVDNGIPGQTGECDECNCLIYELTPYAGCTGVTLCDAVCCTSNIAVEWFGDNEDLAACTILYSDQTGTPAANGWYFDGEDAVEVSGGTGAVIAIGDPLTCQPCTNETNSFYFDFYSSVNGTGAFGVEKSLDGVIWFPAFSKDISVIPAGTTFNYTGGIAPNTFVRGSLNYGANHTTGTYKTFAEQSSTLLNTYNTVAFTNYVYTPSIASTTGAEYRFSVNLTGPVYDCLLSGGTAWKCIEPACIIDETNSTYVVANYSTACCDPLFIDNDGYAFVDNATYTIDGNCEFPPVTCAICDTTITKSHSGSDYHQYSKNYVCDDLLTTFLAAQWSSLDRPNRFTWYDNSGMLATTGWVGTAAYSGPWGASLSTSTTGTLTIPYTSGQGIYLLVEAGPANALDPISDTFTVQIICSYSCKIYQNQSPFNWTGDWQDCNGNWFYAQDVTPGNGICAIIGTPFTIYGVDLVETISCTS